MKDMDHRVQLILLIYFLNVFADWIYSIINKDPKPCSLMCAALACEFNTLPGQLEKTRYSSQEKTSPKN